MISPEVNLAIQTVAALLRSAQHAVVLTGAGISTPSGIPDFRTPQTGLWTRDDPMRVASLTTFKRRPEIFFNWLRPLAQKMWQAQPNAAHLALAELEKAGLIQTTITQNIDGLHQQAGTLKVLELHGSVQTVTCWSCKKSFPTVTFRQSFLEGSIPRCPVCHSILKPDIVLFEENLPIDVWEEARWASEQADFMLVVGSSLEVVPAAELPYWAVENHAHLVINTMTPTYLDDRADVLLPYDVTEIIPLVKKAALA